MENSTDKKGLDLLNEYFVEKLNPIIGAKTIQIFVIREILDFTALRTEDTKELNTVVTPMSVSKNEQVNRVAFLASKQKAVESRELERMLRTAGENNKISLKTYKEKEKRIIEFNDKTKNLEFIPLCYLKDNLCLTCPRCVLFGATALSQDANIKHRIEYSTAFSLLPWNDIEASITFNAIEDKTQSTKQALNTRFVVKPATIFPSVITLKSVTKEEFILVIKTLLAAKSYGAETRIGGDIRNHIVGIVGAWEEIITSLEFTLELFDKKDSVNIDAKTNVKSILDSYKDYAGNKDKVKIFESAEVVSIIKTAQDTNFDLEFINKIYSSAKEFRGMQE